MRIEVFVDDESVPRHTLEPPATLELDTEGLADGPHRLRVRAIDDSGTVGVEEIPFAVRNGPGIAVVGLSDGDTVRGRIPLLVNAFASRPGDTFEPVRAETPAPIPTWAWVLFLLVVAWGMWYVATELRSNQASTVATAIPSSQAPSGPGAPRIVSQPADAALGKQVYENKCAACHQLTGQGLPGVFPPLKGSTVVTSPDPTEHIRTVLRGLAGKPIGGVTYASAMPAFADQLTDEEVAAVLNHERASWGHQAPPVKPEDVIARR
ncbi:MAG TPA: cytochrome c [Methylomirabilota bacterium]|nr:cytochrome c [Methylomirabilota bacterium]